MRVFGLKHLQHLHDWCLMPALRKSEMSYCFANSSNQIKLMSMKFYVVISTCLGNCSILSFFLLQNLLQEVTTSSFLTSFNCFLSNPAIMNKALEQSVFKSSLEQTFWANHLIAELEGRKSRTPKILNKSCDNKIHVQYSNNMSYYYICHIIYVSYYSSLAEELYSVMVGVQLVRYWVEHSKRNSISPRAHVLLSILYSLRR